MNAAPGLDWRKEFGLSDRTTPTFFPSAASIDAAGANVPQAHALRRAFEVLGLDGILCQNNAPVVYFKEVDRVIPEQVGDLHRRFWNQGLSPLLVLVAPTEVHVYSSLMEPPHGSEPPENGGRLVVRLNRAADAAEIRQFALSVESGEVFRRHAKSFDPAKRVDRALLRNLSVAREQMAAAGGRRRDARVLDNLLCRVVFTGYLFDRGVIDAEYLKAAGITGVSSLHEILSGKRDDAVTRLYALFRQLGEDFNGDLFGDPLAAEAEGISAADVRVLYRLLSGTDMVTGQASLWPYDFAVIPIETISSIYEQFLKATDPEQKRKKGAFYTPRFLAELVLDTALADAGPLLRRRFLDPACGSGIFLVGLFNRLAEEWGRANEGASYAARANGLLGILKNNLFGADENPTACRIAFSFTTSSWRE